MQNVFDAVKQQIDACRADWTKKHLNFREYSDTSPQKRFVTLKIEGDKTKDVAGAANTLEVVLAGKKVLDDNGRPFWNALLSTNGSSNRKLDAVGREFGALITRDRSKSHLKLFGPEGKYTEVQQAIMKRLSADPSSIHALELSDEDFRWACRGGFAEMTTLLGSDVAVFDVVSNPKRIRITGSAEQYQQAAEMIKRRGSYMEESTSSGRSTRD